MKLMNYFCHRVKTNFELWSKNGHHQRSQILDSTCLTQGEFIPEIKLHLISPESQLWHQNMESSPFQDPFWAFFWPGGQGVARYLLDHPELVANKRVLDIGSGCGGCSLAAKLSGASYVLANDIDEHALAATLLNAEENNVAQVNLSSQNLLSSPELWDEVKNSFDFLILGDVFFDEALGRLTLELIRHFLTPEKTILIGDPGRWFLSENGGQHLLSCVAKYEMPEEVKDENNGLNNCFVYKVSVQ